MQTEGTQLGVGGVEQGQTCGEVTRLDGGEGGGEVRVVPGVAPGDAVLSSKTFIMASE